MDILSLSFKATAEVKPSFELIKSPDSGFPTDFAGVKGLAPPGPEPPPIALLAKSGEEGATPEPIAPTQNPDFSPDLTKEIAIGDTTLSFDPTRIAVNDKGDVRADNPLIDLDSPAASLQTVACLGAITVSIEQLAGQVSADVAPLAQKPVEKVDPTLNRRPQPREHGAVKEELIFLNNDVNTKGDPIPLAFNGDKQKPYTGDRQKQTSETGSRPIKSQPVDVAPDKSDQTLARPAASVDAAPPSGPNKKLPQEWNVARPAGPYTGARPRNVDEAPQVDSTGSRARTSESVQEVKDPTLGKQPEEVKPESKPGPVVTKVTVPGEKWGHYTDPFFVQETSEQSNADTVARPKESTKVDSASAEVATPVVAKQETSPKDRGANPDTGARPAPELTKKIASEKEEPLQKTSGVNPTPEGLGKTEKAAEARNLDKPELTPKQAGEVTRQVLDRLETLAASHVGRKVTIHLDPKEFGSITLVVGRRGGEVDAEIYASNDRVRQALEVNRPSLQAGLDQRGIHLASMTVGSQLPHGSGRQEQAMRDMAQQHRFHSPSADQAVATTLSLDAIRGLSRKATGVDLWI